MTAKCIYTLFLISVTITIFIGCEVDSASDLVRSVSINVSGVYSNPNGDSLVEKNSGNPIVRLTIRQNGDQIEAADNNNQIFRGNVTEAGDGKLSFSLEGKTTTGMDAIFSGTFTVSGTTSIMAGTFIEEEGYSLFWGQSTVSPPRTDPEPDRASSFPQASWSGCCSGHDGIKTNNNGQVVVTYTGYARCNDGTASPSCNENNR